MDDGDYYEDEDDLYESEDDLELEDERATQPGAGDPEDDDDGTMPIATCQCFCVLGSVMVRLDVVV